jgi:hypothetical protein
MEDYLDASYEMVKILVSKIDKQWRTTTPLLSINLYLIFIKSFKM